jgi:hypothetical protein
VPKKPKAPLVKSSVPAGTPLKGLNFLKNATDPVAMEDSEYPAWLWTVLDKQEKKAEKGAAGDLFCMCFSFFPSPICFSIPSQLECFCMLTLPPSEIQETASSSRQASPQGTARKPRHAGA